MKQNGFFFAFLCIVLTAAFTACEPEPEVPTTQRLVMSDVTISGFTENSVAFAWKAVENASAYQYKIVAESDQSVVVEQEVSSATLQAEVSGLESETEYTLQIRAMGEGVYTDSEWKTAKFTTAAVPVSHVIFNDKVLERFIFDMQPAVDADGDGVISFEEAKTVKVIDAGFEYQEDATDDKTFADLTGLEYFTSLDTLNLKWHRVSDATPIESLSSLSYLNLGENKINALDLTNLTNLLDLRLYGTGVSSLDFNKTPKMVSLYMQRTKLTVADISVMPNLELALFNESKLTELRAVGLQKLTRLDAVKNEITTLEVSDCEALSELHLNNNNLTTLSLDNLPKLMRLNVYSNKLTALETSNLPFLLWIFAYDNQIESVDFSKNVGLREAYLSNNPIKKIDLSANDHLTVLESENMPGLIEINLKNDFYDEWAEYYIVEGNTALQKVVVDAGPEYDHVSNLFKNNSSVSIVTE